MKPPRTTVKLFVTLCFAVIFLAATTRTVSTFPLFVNKAKQLGFPAQNCTYCHTSPQGGVGHNARGRWLIAEKARRGAASVDIAWLKGYKAAAATTKARRKG